MNNTNNYLKYNFTTLSHCKIISALYTFKSAATVSISRNMLFTEKRTATGSIYAHRSSRRRYGGDDSISLDHPRDNRRMLDWGIHSCRNGNGNGNGNGTIYRWMAFVHRVVGLSSAPRHRFPPTKRDIALYRTRTQVTGHRQAIYLL